MWQISLGFGIALILQGLGFYFGTGMKSWTALIPALFFGLPIAICGLLSRQDALRRHAAHVAALFGLLGMLGGFGMSIPKLAKGGLSVYAQFLMGLICLVYLVFCVRSFILARRSQS